MPETGQTISHYKILEKIGEGGMGVVYKAEDTKLKRTVALKFLPDRLSASEEDKARFMQEAQSAAALNHPNICTIHGIDEYDGQMFIAMEFVDGRTLRDQDGAMSFKQALDIGIQVADGLSAAHEKGIVHRDIKPDNIMVRKDGIVQIMDFGLAKLRASGSKITRLTKQGSTVGTAGYMSPEQVQGHDADHRSDIFSFGVLLYELLTGQLPFKGVHETALAYEIVNVDPAPMSTIKPDIDPNLDAIVLDCLEKDKKERCQSVAEVARDLRKIKRESTRQRHSRITAARPAIQASGSSHAKDVAYAPPSEEITAPSRTGMWKWAALIFMMTTIASVAWLYLGNPPREARSIRSFIPMPDKTRLSNYFGGGHVAISPGGDKIVFVTEDSTGARNLWVRSLDALNGQMLAGTEGALFPFWSPDGRTIGFFDGDKLKKIDAAGGTPFTICNASNPRGGSWSESGTIVLAPRSGDDGIHQVSAAGGEPSVVTRLDTARKESTHRWPFFLPDGDHFLFFIRSTAAGSGSDADSICVGSVSTGEVRRFQHGISDAQYANGQILYMRETALMAQPFDYENATMTGNPVPIVQQIQYDNRFSKAVFTVSNNGLLLYQAGGSRWGREIAIFDTSSSVIKSLGQLELLEKASLSPDAKRIAMEIVDLKAHNTDIWIYEIARGLQTRFTFDSHADYAPIWSPDGKQIVFSSDRKNKFDLYVKNTSGSAPEELLTDFGGLYKFVQDWSPDGKYLLVVTRGDSATKEDLWILPVTGERKPVPFLRTEFSEVTGAFSPDMQWIAYISDESGRQEVYVRPFIAPDGKQVKPTTGKWQVSTGGARGVLWRRDGKAIFFTAGSEIWLADVRVEGQDFEVLGVKPYMNYRAKRQITLIGFTSDGQTLLGWTPPTGERSVPFTLVTNWDGELK